MARTWQRWVPAVAVPAVIAAAVVGGAVSTASADLPEKTPQEVLALAAGADVSAYSGDVEQTSDLGLPDVSGLSSGGSGSSGSRSGSDGDQTAADALELLTADHSARVYVDGDAVRIQVLDKLAERDVVASPEGLWLYDSKDASAVHVTRGDGAAPDGSTTPETQTLSPAEVAQRFLDSVGPSTEVSLGPDASVAGRDAYDLVLTPRGDDTLVGSVSIAVDAQTGLPLRVQVLATGASDPAFEVGFTSISYDTPSADLFTFAPPAGTDVTEKDASDWAGDHGDGAGPADASHPKPTVTGEGWSSVVSIPTGQAGVGDLTSSPLFSQLATKVDGGYALQTTLMTALITDDGRVLVGAVPLASLQSAAAQ
ncbi:outer membrane lipoprotein carrier protein LolA [Cnuibacter sp. UC19_7]|uniref:LolA family protein n=1 Tax=Cnuibacter sp. UC19_7 TaxID=3350166 RepID=UPI00366EB820